MEILYYTIALFSLLLYSKAFYFNFKLFFTSPSTSKKPCYSYVLAFITHTFLLIILAIMNHRCPSANSGEVLIFFSFLFSLAYLFPYFLFKKNPLAFLFFIPIIIPCILSLIIIQPTSYSPNLHSNYFSFHIISSLTAYCCLTVSSLFSIMYLLLLNKLKEHDFGVTFQKLPSLNDQEKISLLSLTVGIFFMFIASIVGRIWVLQTPNPVYFENLIFIIIAILGCFVLFTILKITHFITSTWFHRLNITFFILLILIQTLGIHGFK